MFDVCTLVNFFIDDDAQQINLYSFSEKKTVFSGSAHEAAFSEFGNKLVQSIDTIYEPTDTLTINID